MGPYCGFCNRHCAVRYPDGTLPCVFEEAERKKKETARSAGGEPSGQQTTDGTETTDAGDGNETA